MAKIKIAPKQDIQMTYVKKEVVFCNNCVVSNQRPRITINKEGVCSACEWAWRKYHVIKWREREEELKKLLSKYRSKDGSWDVIVPGSGGKDSGYVAHQLKYVYGMHPLCVTWAPFKYTDIGWKNFNNFVDSGFDVLTFYPNGKLHRKLARVAFETIADAWQPFTYGQKAYAMHMALKFKIPLVFYGENGEVEYGGSIEDADRPFEPLDRWERHHFRGVGVDKMFDTGIKMGLIKKGEFPREELGLYRTPPFEQLKKLGVRLYWFSYFKKWIPQENFYYAQKHTDFVANEEGRSEGTYSKYASLDDRMDGFHFYLAYIKFGIARATSDAAHEIRDGHITRDEAIALVKRYDGEFPKKYFQEFLEYLDIDEKHFWKIVDSWRPTHLWKKVNGEFKLRHTAWCGGVDD